MASPPGYDGQEIELTASSSGNNEKKQLLAQKNPSLLKSMSRIFEGERHRDNPDNAGSEQNDLGLTSLIVAARNGHVKEVRILLANNDADLNATAKGGITALHVASFCGHAEVVKELLLQRVPGPLLALLTARTAEEQFTALHMASHQDNDSIVRIIWDAFQSLQLPPAKLKEVANAGDCIGWTPLHHAAWIGNTGVVNHILSWQVVDVNAEDDDAFTALHLACWKGHLEIVTTILNFRNPERISETQPNKKAKSNDGTRARISKMQKDVDWKSLPRPSLLGDFIVENRSKVTALHYAVENNHEKVAMELLKTSEIDVKTENSEGKSALDMVLDVENKELLWELLRNYREKPEFWESVRKELSIRGYKNFISKGQETQEIMLNNCGKLLQKVMAKPHEDDKRDDEIHFLLTELERKLIEMNTPIEQNAKDKVSLLHHAAFAGLEKIVDILTDIPGMDVNVLDSDRQTPLHYAALSGHQKVAKVLMNVQACRANAEDDFGRTALQLAVECKRQDVEKLLLERHDVRDYVDRFYRNRQVYVDAANAMLLGAALIASVTFAGWLQPPAGFTQYYQLEDSAAPPGIYDSYASVEQHTSTRVFWVFNSLSFFFAIATVIAGAGAVLPTLDVFIGQEVRLVKRTLVATSTLLVFSVVFILGAFAAAGYASLPPIPKYERMMSLTVIIGAFSCVLSMGWFLKRLYGIRPTWWRKLEQRTNLRVRSRSFDKTRSTKDLFSKPHPF